jgi:glycerol-3-phosphate acyltransferase PlsY
VFRLLLLPAAYLYASLNWAILITRWVRGVDIRGLGTRNPPFAVSLFVMALNRKFLVRKLDGRDRV